MGDDLSIALCLRDDEERLPIMVQTAVALAEGCEGVGDYEILALDERSHDNTLAALSILHAQVPRLRTLQDVRPGMAIRRAARVARGRVWLFVDAPPDPSLAQWAVEQCLRGHRAALVDGQLLAVEQGLGRERLLWLRGGLVTAQRDVEAYLRECGEPAARVPPRGENLRQRAERFLRGRVARLGLGRLDRPAR